jgi:hypothetical protein
MRQVRGVDLQQITIKYSGLTPEELRELEQYQVLMSCLSENSVLTKFPETGDIPLVEAKATAVVLLGA